MFTGIIQNLGKVAHLEKLGASVRLRVATGFTDLQLGESVAVNGVCLTVAEVATLSESGQEALYFVSQETLSLTNLKSLASGSSVNLERALTLSTRLSGHMVQGHVDGLAQVIQIAPLGDAGAPDQGFKLEVEIDASVSRYCIQKGSIALDGVSLTINSISENRLQIVIVPHTWEHTRFKTLKAGDFVNVEVDPVAKYVEKLCQPYSARSNSSG